MSSAAPRSCPSKVPRVILAVKMATTSTRNTSTLQKKYEVIDMSRKNTEMSVWKHFSCGTSQIATVIKNKASITSPTSRIIASHQGKELAHSEFVDINEPLHKWYLCAVSLNIYPGGPQVWQGQGDYRASGIWWLQIFKWMVRQVEKKVQCEKNEN